MRYTWLCQASQTDGKTSKKKLNGENTNTPRAKVVSIVYRAAA